MNKTTYLLMFLCLLLGFCISSMICESNKDYNRIYCKHADVDDWDSIYITGNQTQFLISDNIEGRLVYPKYIILNLQNKRIIDVIETFHHEMAHLYIILDEDHFILGSKATNWNEYKDIIGVIK